MEVGAVVGICGSILFCAIGALIIANKRIRDELKSNVVTLKPSRSDTDLSSMLPTSRHERVSDPTPVSSEV